MPTENRSSNTEMVRVPAELEDLTVTKCIFTGENSDGSPFLTYGRDPKSGLLTLKAFRLIGCRIIGHQAEQHQGEPVALPERKPEIGQDPFSNKGWNACLDEIAKLGPLYTRPAQGEPVAWEMDDTAGESGKILVTNDTRVRDEWVRNELPVAPLFGHADPGEVERLRAELAEQREIFGMQEDKIDTLRAQLDEREALLIEAKNIINLSDVRFLARVDAVLSASAEPSAPVAWHVGGNGYDRICFEEPRDLPGHPCVQAISDQRQLISLLKRYNLRDEDPSAPAERDELVSEDELRDMASIACQSALAHGVSEDWFMQLARSVEQRARAALDRKP